MVRGCGGAAAGAGAVVCAGTALVCASPAYSAKFVIGCLTPFSKISKSSLVRPRTRWPALLVTKTSTFTMETSIDAPMAGMGGCCFCAEAKSGSSRIAP